MKIEYTYKQPLDQPIEKAIFKATGGGEFEIFIGYKNVAIMGCNDNKKIQTTGSFGPSDFADFTALINRINRQIGNE